MVVNKKGIDLIKSFESCKLEVYRDMVGYPTVGWGHRTQLKLGTTITQQEADDQLVRDVLSTSEAVEKCITAKVTDNQFAAMVCLAFNVGVGNLRSSTLLKLVNEGKIADAAEEFQKWDRAGGKEVPGLLRRRLAERDLFLTA